MGQCGRLWLRSLAIGIDEIVKMTEQNDAVSKWHLNGYSRKCIAQVRRHLAAAALAGRPSESMLLELMEDNRFLLHCDKHWEVLTDEHQYIVSSPVYTYSTIARLIKVETHEYQSQL